VRTHWNVLREQVVDERPLLPSSDDRAAAAGSEDEPEPEDSRIAAEEDTIRLVSASTLPATGPVSEARTGERRGVVQVTTMVPVISG